MPNNRPGLTSFFVKRSVLFWFGSMIVLFLPAGTLDYWQAWMYLLLLFIPAIFVMGYFYIKDPEFLQRRMNYNEPRQKQKKIVIFGDMVILLAFILPGFDRRWGWSQVPTWLVINAEIGVLLGYALIVRVFFENRYASRVVAITENQKVISTGPYAWVRHPMYCGTLFMYLLSPLALGSFWAMLPASLIIPMLVMRIFDEEALLNRDLPGYTEYTQKVHYRVIPKIW